MSVAVDSPWYLLLLLVIPILALGTFRSLSGLGSFRRLLALTLRAVVLTLIVLALAQFQWVKVSDRLAVIYLLDQSLSIPEPHRLAMAEYVNAEVERHRNGARGDRAGVIVFARQPAIEYPAVDDNLKLTGSFEALVDPEYTDLAGALKMAQAMFPVDAARRLVLVTDGNENLGDALEQSRALAESGVGIDVLPVRYTARSEVSVEKLAAPTDMQRGQPFELRVVLSNSAQPGDPTAKPIPGKLVVVRRNKDRETTIAEEPITVEPGKRVFTLKETIDAADFYTYEARFVPDRPADDAMPQNNRATAFTHVRGQGQVLVIEDSEHRGDFDHLVDQLRRANLQVTLMPTNELFATLAELQPYDSVVLANVPREAFSEEQVKMLVSNTQQMGSGLVMLGGPNSFGAGGWANSPVEEAMPLDFQVKNSKVVPTGALALVIDRSGSMSGDKLAMARAAALAAVDVLSDRDYVSVSAFDDTGYTVVPLTRVEQRGSIKARINRISSGGGTNMEPGMTLAHTALIKATDAAIRHMLVLTDGQTMGSGYEQMANRYRRQGITVSTVAVGQDADQQLLRRIATIGGGKFYHAQSPRILPRIFQKEARMVSRPLVFEHPEGMAPQVKFPHEMLKGIEGSLPPITGYVLTQLKESPLVEVSLVAPLPASEENRTLLASWNYGLGKSVAFTTDAGRRWAGAWNQWSNQEKLYAQMIRWSMRPSGSTGNYTVTTSTRNGKAEVIVDALDKDDQFLDFLNVGAHVVGPDLKPRHLEIRQTAPGRYRGEFPTDESGSYFLTIVPGAGAAPLISGLNVGYSREYLDREANEPLLKALAALQPQGGEPGVLIDDPRAGGLAAAMSPGATGIESLLAYDTFRRTLAPATSRQDVWPLLVFLASCLFFADVFVRRVQVDLSWVPAYLARLRAWWQKKELVVEMPTMARLKGRKAEVSESLEARRAAVHYEPATDHPGSDLPATEIPLEGASAVPRVAPARPTPSTQPGLTPDAPAEDGYTSRLLKAKRKVWDERDR